MSENGAARKSGPSAEALRRGHVAARLSEDARLAVRSRASPEGIVTILFTDIVKSTRLRQRIGDDAAQELFRHHYQTVREQFVRHSGLEVKTAGDGFMVAFGDVGEALSCAVEIQRAVAVQDSERRSQRIEVRVGLHCGRVLQEEEDFFGSSVVIAARLVDLANGGEILVSETVRGLAGIQPTIRYVRYGRRRLKGLTGAYEVWSVPWEDGKRPRLVKLWARPVVRVVAAAAVILAAAGVAGVLFLNGVMGRDTPAPPAYQEIVIHVTTSANVERVSGDCESEDLVVTGTTGGPVTGDISGRSSGTFRTTLSANDDCMTTHTDFTYGIQDAGGNGLSLKGESFSIARLAGLGEEGGPGRSSEVSHTGLVIVGGTGIYDGASGKGTCVSLSNTRENSPGSRESSAQSENSCTLRLVAGGAAEPGTLQAVTNLERMTLFSSPIDLPKAAVVVVLYRNNSRSRQTGLWLRLPAPEGAQIRASAPDEENQAPTGEREWRLPDLERGAFGRFEFAVNVLSAGTPTLQLAPELDADELRHPVRSDPLTIEIGQ